MLKKLTTVSQKLSPGLQKIIYSIGWLTFERILAMSLSLLIGVYVVRYLGAEDFGKLSYSASFVALFSAIAILGLDDVVLRNVVREEAATSEILGTAFILKLIGSVVTFGLIVWVTWMPNEADQVRWITTIIAAGLVFNSFEVIDLWFKSQVLAGAMARVRMTKLILSSVAKLLFISLGLPLIAFAWLMLADLIFQATGMLWAYLNQGQSLRDWQFNSSRAINLLKDSWPLILSGMMVTIYMKIDQVMLGTMANNAAVGNYAAAVRFSEIWYFVPMTICASVFPAIVRAKQRSKQEYYRKLQQLYDMMAWLSLSIALPMSFLSPRLMTAILGQEYTQAGEILAWHIWAGPFVFLGVARGKWLMAENLTKLSFAATSLGAITNILLNFWLIPSYEGTGAAIATAISQAVACFLIFIFYPPTYNTCWMLIKALLIPFRIRQNINYINQVKKILF